MAKIAIFDCFGTLLDKQKDAFFEGLEFLRTSYFPISVSAEETKNAFLDFIRDYLKTRTVNEVTFFDFLTYVEERFGFSFALPKEKLERAFYSSCRKEVPAPGIAPFLKRLKEKGYRLYVLSNTIFSAGLLKEELDKHGLLSYFDALYFSSAYGVRKPSDEFYSCLIKGEGIQEEDEVLFFGDTYADDIAPSFKRGFRPYWRNGRPSPEAIAFSDYRELMDQF